MIHAVFFGLILNGSAFAKNATQAEHDRLSEEMERLVQRQVWTGVEQTFEELERLDVALTQQDYLHGAFAARELGNVQSVYERLILAKELGSTQEINDWLMNLVQNYGHVELMTVPNRGTELTAELMPFDVNQRKAVEMAIAAASDDGHFVGMIPRGNYVFAGQPFTVDPGVSVRIEVSPRTRRQGIIEPVILYRDTPAGLSTPSP